MAFRKSTRKSQKTSRAPVLEFRKEVREQKKQDRQDRLSREMLDLGINPTCPEVEIARRLITNRELQTFLLHVAPEHRQEAYDKLKPMLSFEAMPLDALIPGQMSEQQETV